MNGETEKTKDELRRLGRKRLALVLGVIGVIIAGAVAPFVLLGAEDPARASTAGYSFGSENVITGTTVDPTNKNAEDGVYEQLVEGDTYTDTNFSISTETITTGTGGGTATPTGTDTSDNTYRTYAEADGSPSDYSNTLVPTSDSSVGFDATYPTSPTTHFDKVDEGVSHDSASTYNRAITNADRDLYGMGDMSAPSGTPDLDVAIYFVMQDAGTGTAYGDAGLRISSADYVGINDQAAPNVWDGYTYSWELNPSTSSEWTYTAINAIEVYVEFADAAPDVDVTSIYLVVTVDYTASYAVSVTETFSSVTSTAQTTGYKVLLEAKTSDTESIYAQAWDYTGLSWTTKATISATSDTDYSFTLASTERDGSANEVKVRFLGATESGDASQTTVSVDLCRVMRIEQGYALEVEMTASSVNEYGQEQLRVKGYTSSESFACHVWNWTSSAYDEDKITVSALSNTLYTYNLIEEHHRSGAEQVKVAFEDTTVATSDTTRDTMYLDLLEVSWTHTAPSIEDYDDDGPANVGETVSFWLQYVDADNDAPSSGYPKVNIGGTDYLMVENGTDTLYVDGKAFHYSTSALVGGTHDYYFKVKDDSSSEVTTVTDQVTINRAPSLSQDGVDPAVGSNGETFSFFVVFTDEDCDMPAVIEVVIDATPYTMTANSSGDTDTTDGKGYFHEKVMAGGSHSYYFQCSDYLSAEVETTPKDLDVNNGPSLSDYSRLPADPVYPSTLITFQVEFTDVDGDMPTDIRWRESEGAIQNLSLAVVDPLDLDTTDGKLYATSVYLSHGSHEYDFWATDGLLGVSGGDNSLTVQNRAPTIDNDPGTPSTYRNTYWEFDFAGTDLDGDSIGWAMSTNASFLDLNPTTGLVYGTTSDPVAWYSVTVWLNDSYSGSDSLAFTLSVVNRAPVITSSGNTTQPIDTFMRYLVTYSDADGDSATLGLSTNASWLSLDGNYVEGTATPAGWYWVSVWVNDSYGGSDLEEWQVTVTEEENEPPTFTSTPITEVQNGTWYSYDANATDPEDLITFALAGNCTGFLTIDEDLGYVNGTPALVGWYTVAISCTDSESTVWQNYSLVVGNTAPEVTSSPVTDGELGVPYYYDCNADDVNGDTLVFSLFEGPDWLFVDPVTGELEGTPTTWGDLDVVVRVWDGYTLSTDVFVLSVPSNEEPEEPEPVPEPDPLPPEPDPVYDDDPILGVDPMLGYGVIIAALLGVASIIMIVFMQRKKRQQSRKKK